MKRLSLLAPLFALGLILTACGGGLKGPESLQPPQGEGITPPAQQPSGSAQPGAATTPQAEGETITPDNQPSPQAGTEQPEAPADPAMNQAADDAAVLENNRQIIAGNIKDLIANGQISNQLVGRFNLGNLPPRQASGAPGNQPAVQPSVITIPGLKEVTRTIDPKIAAKILQGVNLQGGKIGTPVREACGTHSGQKLRSNGECVCAGSAPTTEDTEEDKSWVQADENSPLGIIHLSDGTPRCVRKVQVVKLALRIANHDGAEDTQTDVTFELCRTENFGSDFPCFSAIIKADPNQKKNDVERIDFSADPSAKWQYAVGSKKIGEIRWPDDFLYFRLVPTEVKVRPDAPVTLNDEMLIAGLTLHIKAEGRNLFDTVYRNPAVFKEIKVINGIPIESRHSLYFDDAYVVRAFTEDENKASGSGTDRNIHFVLPLKASKQLPPSTFNDMILNAGNIDGRPHFMGFAPSASSHFDTELLGVNTALIINKVTDFTSNDLFLDLKLDWYDYDDFHSAGGKVLAMTYGRSLFNSSISEGGSSDRSERIGDKFYFVAEGGEINDVWHYNKITACHINPRRFAITGPDWKCNSSVLRSGERGKDPLTNTKIEEDSFGAESSCPEDCTAAGSTF